MDIFCALGINNSTNTFRSCASIYLSFVSDVMYASFVSEHLASCTPEAHIVASDYQHWQHCMHVCSMQIHASYVPTLCSTTYQVVCLSAQCTGQAAAGGMAKIGLE